MSRRRQARGRHSLAVHHRLVSLRWERLHRNRGVRASAAVLAAVAALVLFRSTLPTDPVPLPQAAGPTLPAPRVVAIPRPTPPFDTRPGRTPIPAPTRSGDALVGTVPAHPGPDLAAARVAVAQVLGRFCLQPDRYGNTLEPDRAGRVEDWRHVRVLIFDAERSYTAPALRLGLDWTGPAYRWTGPPALLRGC
jgi:hypothetical protein